MGGRGSNPRDLPTEHLTTTDKQGRRVYVYPAEVRGRFRSWRTAVHSVLILVFLALPWLKIRGHQAILLDIARRRFAIFGITFWAHDAPRLVFIFGGAALTLGLITAVWGRVWCGWACPQTVFIDSIFRWIERKVEGDHLARRKLDAGAWEFDKIFKKTIKWMLFAGVSLVITHSFLAYFVGTENLAEMMRHDPSENVFAFGFVMVLTGAILFDFGWFREQFCTVLCPYGRFQSVLMDGNSLLVTYDAKRNDCVNCFRCVQVCPTGIDIRRGTQLECVACTACIDACDDVMTRIHKPRGLIRYDSEVGLAGGKTRMLRARTAAYGLLIVAAAAGLAISLITRRSVDMAIVRAADTPYQEIARQGGETEIVNRFKVDLVNQSFEDLEVVFQASTKDITVVTAQAPLKIGAGRKMTGELFITFPKKMLSSGKVRTQILVQKNGAATGASLNEEEVTLVGPFF